MRISFSSLSVIFFEESNTGKRGGYFFSSVSYNANIFIFRSQGFYIA